jgi:hypothetical protein
LVRYVYILSNLANIIFNKSSSITAVVALILRERGRMFSDLEINVSVDEEHLATLYLGLVVQEGEQRHLRQWFDVQKNRPKASFSRSLQNRT